MTARDTVSRMIKIARKAFGRCAVLNKSIPPAVEAMCGIVWPPTPHSAIKTARDLQEDLQAQLDQEPLKHRRQSVAVGTLSEVSPRAHPRLTSVTTAIASRGRADGEPGISVCVARKSHRQLEAKATLTRVPGRRETAYFL